MAEGAGRAEGCGEDWAAAVAKTTGGAGVTAVSGVAGGAVLIEDKAGIGLAEGMAAAKTSLVAGVTGVGKTAVGTFVGKGDNGEMHPPSPSAASIARRIRHLLTIFAQNGRYARQTIIPIQIIIIRQQHGNRRNVLRIQPIGTVSVNFLVR